MNKRIQELANQAGLFTDLDGKPGPKALSAEESITAYNKFAQLIVGDFLRLVENYCETSPEILGLPIEILDHFDMEIKDE